MYRPAPTLRERAGPLAAVVLLHAGIGYALLHLSGAEAELARQADLAIFDVLAPPPPAPPAAAAGRARRDRGAAPEGDEGAAAPPNIESEATPVVAPEPRIVIPAPSPIVTTTTPSTGAAPTQGAAPVPGPGTGAGGDGHGNRQRRIGHRPRRRRQRPWRGARAAGRRRALTRRDYPAIDPPPLATARRGVHHPARRARWRALVVPRDALVRRRRDRCRDLPPGAGAAPVRAGTRRARPPGGGLRRLPAGRHWPVLTAINPRRGGSPSPRATPRWAR